MSSVRERITGYCWDVIGCSYDYTPSGGVEYQSYNCSYLSTCAYADAGIEIPSWQGHQNGNGSQSDWVRWNGHWTTDPDELLPGDLVFFGESPYDTGHVGISTGGEWMIDSVPNGGVQHRRLYGSFVGGGWPLRYTPEEEARREEERRALEIAGLPMNAIITISDKNTVVWLSNDAIHDLTDPDDIRVLDQMWGAGHDGAKMPRIQLTADWYARLCQACRAGYPKHLKAVNEKFAPRS